MVTPIDEPINHLPLNTEWALQTAARRHARGRRQMIPTTKRSDLSLGVFSFVSTIVTLTSVPAHLRNPTSQHTVPQLNGYDTLLTPRGTNLTSFYHFPSFPFSSFLFPAPLRPHSPSCQATHDGNLSSQNHVTVLRSFSCGFSVISKGKLSQQRRCKARRNVANKWQHAINPQVFREHLLKSSDYRI